MSDVLMDQLTTDSDATLQSEHDAALPLDNDANNTTDLSIILDIPVTVSLEVGQAELSINELLALKQDSVIELDRKVGEALDVRVNGRLIAQGEVVEVNGQYGIRLSHVVKQPADAAFKLN
ncbi:flagellar motor switch protein FliN [Endozoicomonas ascidiicola]|uniref:flagellar motor switch protein FliN n=1 Tax=Endozoicomonas ascidiicola TaxID=1698521 RepID=UPI00082F8139|nr:flagellar motor switch protein FliN [Endozoicomonas ascidiicola]